MEEETEWKARFFWCFDSFMKMEQRAEIAEARAERAEHQASLIRARTELFPPRQPRKPNRPSSKKH